MLEPWPRLDSTVRASYEVFRVREDRCRSPRTGQVHSFYVIESNPWVNVIPLTPDGRIVCVEQYRHGIEAVTLEIPGGVVDAADETPRQAARREMREETGYDSAGLVDLGVVAPNPAILNNRCYTFLAPDAHPVGGQHLDGTEEIAVTLVDAAEVPALIRSGRISHALVVAAFYLFDLWQRTR